MADGVPGLSWVPAAEDPARYAEVSGDRSPIHLDEDLARAEGLPGVILHGMHVFGQVVAHLDRHAPAGHVLGSARVRFLDVSVPGERVEVSFAAVDDDDRSVSVAFSGEQRGRPVLGSGVGVFLPIPAADGGPPRTP